MLATARSGYMIKIFVASLATPWLILLSTSIPLYLKNQAELHYQFDILLPFAIVTASVALLATMAILWIDLRQHPCYFCPVVWIYFLSGILFLAVSSLNGLEFATALKAGLAILFVVLAVVLAKALSRNLPWTEGVNYLAAASLLFIALDLVQLFNRLEINTPDYSQRNDVGLKVDSAVSQLDRLPNIYHILLDEYQTDMFLQTLNENVEAELAGFHFYPEATTLFGRTGMSLPSIFTGRPYDFATPQIDYQQSAFNSDRSFLYWLRRAGYRVSAYLHPVYDFDQPLFEYVTYHKDIKHLAADRYMQVFKQLWIYSTFPSGIAAAMLGNEYMEQQKNQNILDPVAPVMSLNTMRRLLREEGKLGNHGRYLFAHLILPHFPYVLRDDCSYSEEFTSTSPVSQSRCATRLIIDLVRTLKKLHRFSDSLIIVQSDHGARFAVEKNRLVNIESFGTYSPEWSRARSRTLLLIKPNGVSEKNKPFVVSNTPTTLLDIAPTLVNALKLKTKMRMSGIDLFGSDAQVENRTRYYHFFDKKTPFGITDEITRYRIDGNELRNEGKIKLTNNPM